MAVLDLVRDYLGELHQKGKTRKVKPIWIYCIKEIVSGSGISWAICKSTLYPDI